MIGNADSMVNSLTGRFRHMLIGYDGSRPPV